MSGENLSVLSVSRLNMAARNQVNGSPRKKPRTEVSSKVTVILGAQWGDEGKGKVVDMLATHADIVCRCQVSKLLFHVFVLK